MPCSTSCITAVVVAITLVSDAKSKIVSNVIASWRGSKARVAIRLSVDHLPVMPHNQNRPGNLLLGNRLLNDRIHRGATAPWGQPPGLP